MTEGPHTGRFDPRTSHRAARRLKPGRLTIRDRVLSFAADRPEFIDEDLVDAFPDAPESSYRKRRTELTEEGWIVDSERTRNNRDGNAEIVWVYRSKHPSPPPLRSRRATKATKGEVRAQAEAHATRLDQFAASMKKEGRGPFANALLDAADFIRNVTA